MTAMAVRGATRAKSRRTDRHHSRAARPLLRAGVLVYQQIAALIAAFALIAFLGHFIDFEWRGFVSSLVSQWTEYVRPAMKWLLHLLVTAPLEWLGWHVEVPLSARDYLAVGLMTTLSMARETSRANHAPGFFLRLIWEGDNSPLQKSLLLTIWLPLVPLIWPLTILTIIALAAATSGLLRRESVSYILMLSPLLYLGLLLAANFIIL